jgi:hypothetical protein
MGTCEIQKEDERFEDEEKESRWSRQERISVELLGDVLKGEIEKVEQGEQLGGLVRSREGGGAQEGGFCCGIVLESGEFVAEMFESGGQDMQTLIGRC